MAIAGRAFLKGVTLSMGMMEITGDLYGPKVSGADKVERFSNCCSLCGPDDPTKMKQRYICPNHPDAMSPTPDEDTGAQLYGFPQAECLSGQVGDDKVLRVIGSKEEVKEVKQQTDLEKSLGIIEPRPAAQVEANTFPMGTAYVFEPARRTELYENLVAGVDHEGHMETEEDVQVLTFRINLKGSEKLCRLQSWKGRLVIQELVRPEDLRELEAIEAQPTKNLELLRQLVGAMSDSFDPADYESSTRKHLAEFVAARAAGDNVVPITKSAAPAPKPEDDMEAQLAAALAAARAKKVS